MLKKIITSAVLILFSNSVYAVLDECIDPTKVTSYQFTSPAGNGPISCANAVDCSSKHAIERSGESFGFDRQFTFTSIDFEGGKFIQYFSDQTATKLTSPFTVTTTSGNLSNLNVSLVCTDSQCSGNNESPPFQFTSDDDNGGNISPSSICIGSCTANKVNGMAITFGDGGDGGFTGTYQPSELSCTTETLGTNTPITEPPSLTFELNNESVKALENTEQCATDSFGNQTCVPLIEKGSGSVTDLEGRDMTVNPQSENCGTVNGEFTCIPSTGTGIATITDSNGNVYTLDNPKNPINNPTVNLGSGDSDSPYSTTETSSSSGGTSSSVTNSTNETGGTGTGTLPTGNTGGDAVVAGKLDTTNSKLTDIQAGIGAINTKLDELNGTDYNPNPEVTGLQENLTGFYGRLSAVPIIGGYQNISISFAQSTCATPAINFSILGQPVNGDLSMACDVINDISGILALIMNFIFLFFGARIVISA